jgi:hypothetical protein
MSNRNENQAEQGEENAVCNRISSESFIIFSIYFLE